MTHTIYDYLTKTQLQRIQHFSQDKPTPHLIINLETIAQKYDELHTLLPYATIYYAMKANPLEEVTSLLHNKGSHFDVASIYEMDQLFNQHIPPQHMSFGNTIKKPKDIAYAYQQGIRLFTTDSDMDLEHLAQNAPGSHIIFRIISEGSGSFADWPLSRKFGAHPDLIYDLILKAKHLGLHPYGLSFHVGSQQRNIPEWDHFLTLCKDLFDQTKTQGISLETIDIGGGFPAHYLHPTTDITNYTTAITTYLKKHFKKIPKIILEPGRSLTADSGIIISEVINVAKKSPHSPDRWVYLDIGKFGGLIETLDESIKYPLFVERYLNTPPTEIATGEVFLAGPTCDSYDIIYEKFKYHLPLDLKSGDKILIPTTGAYTQTYSSICFNGFPPLKAYILPP